MMTTDTIIESGLTFGPFQEGFCFHIEKSQTYKSIEKGVKMVEFLLLRPSSKVEKPPAIWMIEAKNSSPKPESDEYLNGCMKEVREKLTNDMSDEHIKEICKKLTGHPFDIYIGEICNKFINALTLIIAIRLKRHSEGDSELSKDLKQLDLANVRFVFVLVINKCEEAWLPPIKEALEKALRPTIKIWALSPPQVFVFNEDIARSKRLIKPLTI
jgi:hypothetical protein